MPNPLLAGTAGETHLLLGNEAIVRGAVEAGINVVTCYPGTPSSEVPDTFYRLSPEGKYYFEYSTNEKVALEVAAGASLGGAMCLCTMKHVGLNVAADPLMTVAYTGTPGGLMVLTADDPGCHSSQNEQDNRIYGRLGGLPVFEPASAQEAKDMARDALLFSRSLGMPVLLCTTTRVNHLRGPVTFGPTAEPQPVAGFTRDPSRFVPIPAFARPMHDWLLKRLAAAAAEAETSPYNTISGDGSVGVIASGIGRAYLSDALAELGLAGRVRVLDLGWTHPIPENLVARFLDGLDAVLVVEELEPVLENDVRVIAQKRGLAPAIHGKDWLSRQGEFTVGMVRAAVERLLGREPAAAKTCAAPAGLPNRPPNLCAGCPHRATYFAVRRVIGDDALYSSDIGCYTLGILPPLKMADFLVCMGSSVSAGSGMAKATGRLVVGFIGDSTFFHSGMTGLANAIFNNHNLLLVVLDNHTTAMTGHQPHPGVEMTILGENAHRLDIAKICEGLGVPVIRSVNPLNLKKTEAALRELKDMTGVRVLIAREPCPLHARRVYKKKPTQTAYVAEGCDNCTDCLSQLACPAFELCDGAVKINEQVCAGCMLCLQICEHIKARKREA
ncbi:MAG: indolepyruvate ferredoxin oxidoreductase subunit alpha [Desulfovibrionaceae bacterium]